MEFKKEEVIVIVLAIILFLGFIFLVKPSTTGYVLYAPATDEYIFNLSLVNFSDNEIKLIPTVIIETSSTTTQNIVQLSAAMQDENNKLSKVNTLNGQGVEIEEDEQDEILDLTFASNLENNDIISVYFKDNEDTNVKICEPSILCPNPYANLNYDGTPKYLNFTLNLSSARNTFGIFPTQEEVKIDYIYATHFTTTTNTNATTEYPSSATIETNDIEPANISRFDYVNYNHTLNEQSIEYYYSTDSGSNWVNITNQNISSLNITKIRIRAVLNSNATASPVINRLSLLYAENETTSQNESNSNDQTNSTNEAVFIREVLEGNNLVYMKIYSNSNLSQETITIDSSNLTNPDKNKLKAIEVNANINFSSVILRINYTNTELGNLNETSLGFYYYNGISGGWGEIEATKNTAENYIEANLTHFSIYGIFGESDQGSGSSGNSGGGSGSSGTATSTSSGGGGDRAPSSRAPEQETILIQNIQQKEEPKEIKLFEQPEEDKKKQDIITAQAVKEVGKPNYLGIYFFMVLVIILYFVYHKHVKKANSGHLKTKIKKLKNHKFKVKKK